MATTGDVIEAVRAAKRVYVIGNGGSYANAVHIVNDLLDAGVRAYTLDPASLTASANDHGYETVFARWLEVVAEPGDLLLALSGSGKSANILRAIDVAIRKRMNFRLITDYLRTMDMQQSEEWQLRMGHNIWRSLKCS